MEKRTWFWNGFAGRGPSRRAKRTAPRHRRLLFESAEPRILLSGSPSTSLADRLAAMTPNPHATGDQPADSSQQVVLRDFTPAPLPPDPGVSQDITDYIAGLRQIQSDIAANAAARPGYWGEGTGGSGYRLHFNDNGMLVRQWTVDWGDAGAPQTFSDQLSAAHHYPRDASFYSAIVTAIGANGAYVLLPQTAADHGQGQQTDTGAPPGADVPGAPPVLRVGANQETHTGHVLDLPALGHFTHASVTGDFHYALDWGDGSTPDTATATITSRGSRTALLAGAFGGRHTYSDAGTYYAAATITDPAGDSDTQTFQVVVNGAGQIFPDTYSPANLVHGSLAYLSTPNNAGAASTGLRTGETITVAFQKGTVPFSSNENRDSPPLIHSPVLAPTTITGPLPVPVLATGTAVLNASGVVLLQGVASLATIGGIATTGSNAAASAGAVETESPTAAPAASAESETAAQSDTTADPAPAATISPTTAAMLERVTPKPHPTGDPLPDGGVMLKLSDYTPSSLPLGLGLSQDLTDYIKGLQQIQTDIAGNPDARPSYWGESITLGGVGYRLHLCDNGMLINQWTVDWGDATAPETYANQLSVVHHYPRAAGRYTPMVTARGANGVYVLLPQTASDHDDFLAARDRMTLEGAVDLPADVEGNPAVLRVVNDQKAHTGKLLDLSPIGHFTHAAVPGTFGYQIDWGDGANLDTGTATVVSPGSRTALMLGSFGGRHTYEEAGVYYVAVTVIDPSGDSDTQTLEVVVNGKSRTFPDSSSQPTVRGSTPITAGTPSPADVTQTTFSGPIPVLDGAANVPVINADGQLTLQGAAAGDAAGPAPTGLGTPSDAQTDTGTTVVASPPDTTQSPVAGAIGTTESDAALVQETALNGGGMMTALLAGEEEETEGDPALMDAVRQTLALAADAPVTEGDWARLTSLSADSNRVRSLDGLEYAVNLQSLTLAPGDFSNPGHLTDLSQLDGLTSLTSLTLQRCGMTDAMLSSSSFPTLSGLETLDLRYNNITTIPSTALSKLPGLATLSLYGNPLDASPVSTSDPTQTWCNSLRGKLLTVDIAPQDADKIIDDIDPADATTTYKRLAAAFYNLPVEIYEYVLNTIDYQPYQGAMKGPLAVLQTKQGNDWDTDSLLMELLTQAGAAGDLDYYTAQVVEPIATAENWLGVQTSQAAYNVLHYAGLRPTMLDASFETVQDPGSSAVCYARFDHAWLEGSVAGQQSVVLDPARKTHDFQPGLSGVVSGVLLDTALTDYLSQTRDELAYEYYEDEVRSWLATNHPDSTIADVPYAGPIHPQVIASLPASRPYQAETAPTSSSTIPTQYTYRAQISVDVAKTNFTVSSGAYDSGTNRTTVTATYSGQLPWPDAFTTSLVEKPVVAETTSGDVSLLVKEYVNAWTIKVEGNYTGDSAFSSRPFSTPILSDTRNLPDISLQRVTIGYTGSGSLSPHLYVDGTNVATGSSVGAPGTPVKIVVQVFPAVSGSGESQGYSTPYAHVYSRAAGKYLAIGLDANQTSPQMLADIRQTVNDANINEKNTSGWRNQSAANQDQLIGGLLQLVAMQYFNECDRGEAAVAGLTQAIPVYNVVASGMAASGTELQTIDAAIQKELQIPFLPQGMGIDVPSNWWKSVSITDDTSRDIDRDNLAGCTNSSMEASVWEEFTNTPAVSTSTSLQYANSHSITIATIDADNVADRATILAAIPDSPQPLRTRVCEVINSYVNSTHRVMIPVADTPSNTGSTRWEGIGYVFQEWREDQWCDSGFIIHGYHVIDGVAQPIESPHGGVVPYIAPTDPYVAPISFTQSYAGDPISTSNGEVMHDETDVSIPNLGTPLAFARHYHSFNTVASGTSWSDRGMGDGWSFSFSDTLTTSTEQGDPSGTKIWFADSGVRLKFTPKQGGGYNTPEGIFGTLTQDGSDFLWTDKTGNTVRFDSAGTLLRMLDRYQDGVEVTYTSGAKINRVSRVLDGSVATGTSAAWLAFAYDSETTPHILSVSDFTGRTWSYGYNANHRLITATAPVDSESRLGEVSYEYYPEDEVREGLLKTVTDPNGGQTQYEYYANRRGMKVTDAEGASHSLSFNLYRGRTEFLDQRHQPTYYSHDDEGNVTQQLLADRTTITSTWQDGLKTSSTDAFGQAQNYYYDANGKPLYITNPLDDLTSNQYSTTATSFVNLLQTTQRSHAASATALTLAPGNVSSYGSLAGGSWSVSSDGKSLTVNGDMSIKYSLGFCNVTANTVLSFDFSSSVEGLYHLVGMDDDGTLSSAWQFQLYGSDTAADGRHYHFNAYEASAPLVKHFVIPVGDFVTQGAYSYLTFLCAKEIGQGTTPTSVFSNIKIFESDATVTQYTYSDSGTSADNDGKSLWKVTSDPSGLNYTTLYEYNWGSGNRGLVTAMTTPKGVLTTGDPNDYKTTYTYNAARQMTSRVSRVSASQTVTEGWDFDALGRLVTSTDGNDLDTTCTYDLLGRLVQQTLPDPDDYGENQNGPLPAPVTTFVYDAAGNVLSTSLATGSPQRTASSVYDKMQRVTKSVNADGTYRTTQYDAAGDVVYETDELGRVTQYVRDSRGRAAAVIRPDGTVVSTAYNGGGQVVSTTDALGNTVEFEYDKLGRKTQETLPDPDGDGGSLGTLTTLYAYDPQGNLQYVTVGGTLGDADYTTEYRYDKLGRQKAVIQRDPDGSSGSQPRPVTLTTYDANGNVASVVDARGASDDTLDAYGNSTSDVLGNNAAHTRQYTYDQMDRKVMETLPDPDGSGSLTNLYTWFYYDANTNLQYVVNPNGAGASRPETYSSAPNYTNEYQYDHLNRKVAEILPDPDGSGDQSRPTTSYAFDAKGNLASVTSPLGAVTRYSYDLRNRQTQVTDALGNTTTSTFDAVGNVLLVTDALGRVTSFEYDAANRKVRGTLPLPDAAETTVPQTVWQYDANGNVTAVTDPLGHTAWTQYDHWNRPVKVTDALGWKSGEPQHTTTTDYNELGLVKTVTDPLGRTVKYLYDNLGRKTEAIAPDPESGEASESDPDCPKTYFGYDANGNLKYTTDPLGSGAADSAHTTWYFYDTLNRQTCVIDTLAGLSSAQGMAEEPPASPTTHRVVTVYDTRGNVKSVTDQMGRVTTAEYDNLGRKTAEIAPYADAAGQITLDNLSQGFTPAGNWNTVSGGYGTNYYSTTFATDTSSWASWGFGPSLASGRYYEVLVTWVCDAGNSATVPYTVYDGAAGAGTVRGAVSVNQKNAPPDHPVFTDADWLSLGFFWIDSGVLTVKMTSLGNGHIVADAVRIIEVSPTSYSYDSAGNVVSTTDPLGHATYAKYDALGRAVRSVSALGSGPDDTHYATTTIYDAVGNVASVTDPEGNTTRYAYDRLGREVAETDPLWNSTSLEYDPAGNLVQATDRNGRVTEHLYDPANRPVEERWRASAEAAVSHTIRTWYDAAGQVLAVTQTDSASTDNRVRYEYAYNALGGLTNERMARSDAEVLSPSENNGTLGDELHNGVWSDWDVDGANERIDRWPVYLTAGQTLFLHLTSTAFNPVLLVRRPTSTWWTDGLVDKDSAADGDAWLMLTADIEGWWNLDVTSLAEDAAGQYTLNALANAHPFVSSAYATLSYTYDKVGNVETATDSTGSVTTCQFDALNRMNMVKQSVGGTVNKRADYAYNADSSRQTITRYSDDGSTTVATTSYPTYDGMGRLEQMQHVFGSTTQSYAWVYDADSRITSMTSPDEPAGFTLTYDATVQLKSANYTSQTDESYAYDSNGNRTASDSTAWTTAAANRLLSDGTFTYTYDSQGNRKTRTRISSDQANDHLTEYTWDNRNRLAGIVFKNNEGTTKRTLTYIYDDANRLVRRIVDLDGNGTTDKAPTYVYQGDQIVLETDAGNQLTHRYLWGAAVDELLADEQIGGELLWALGDHRGTVRDLINSSGVVRMHRQYNAFSRITSQTGAADVLFGDAGRLLDKDAELASLDGLQWNLNRWYDPAASVWISADPSGFGGGDMNLYRACGNNFVMNVDPSGLCGTSISSTYWPTSGIAYYTGFEHTLEGRMDYSPYGPPSLTTWGEIAAQDAFEQAVADTWRSRSWSGITDASTHVGLLKTDLATFNRDVESVRQSLLQEPELAMQVLTEMAKSPYSSLGGASAAEALNDDRLFRGFVINRGQAILNASGENFANLQLESPWKPMAVDAVRGLGTGSKAVVNGFTRAGGSMISFGSWKPELLSVSDWDRSVGYNTAVAFTEAGWNILGGVATGQVAGVLSQGGNAAQLAAMGIRGFDATRNAFDVGSAGVDAYQNGLSWQNGLQMAGGSLAIAGDLSGIMQGARRLSSAGETIADVLPGVQESPWPLPPSAPAGMQMSTARPLAWTTMNTGQMYANPNAWANATAGQRATMFWHEWSHSDRILSSPAWQRPINALLYQTSLGKFAEESMAHSSAMNSVPQGLAYAWGRVNRVYATAEAAGIVSASVATGWWIGDKVFSGGH